MTKTKEKTIIAASLIMLVILAGTCCVSGDDQTDEKIAEYLTNHPLDPVTSAQINDLLARAKVENLKMRLELTHRIEFYFYIANRMDSIMEIYSESLLPFVYQKDLFQGNYLDGTPPILRAPMIINILTLFVQILQPFYVLSILLTAVYLLFISGSPAGRAKAKSTLIKLVIGLGIITLTLPIMETMLETSHYLTSVIISIPAMDSISKPVSTEMFMSVKEFFIKYFLRITFFDVFLGLPFLAILLMIPVGVLVMLSIRYFMVILLTLFFPFTVLLYSFMGTRKIGSSLISQTFLWIFMPVVDGLILVVTWTAYTSTPYISGLKDVALKDLHTFMAISGSLLLIAAPLIGLWIIKWMGRLGITTYIISRQVSSAEAYLESTPPSGDPEWEPVEETEEEDNY